jgi:LysR family glycine cleavage system transcriptional activator
VTSRHSDAVQIPSLQTLRAFEAAGRLQSYSRAGEEVGLTHGAVSRRMRDLEALVGTPLFERRGNRMVPTSDGVRLLAQVRNVLGMLERIFPSRRPRAKRLTMSLSPAVGRWLVPRLGPFRAAHPDLDLRMDVSSQVVALGGEVDAALRYGSGRWPDTDSRMLARESLFPVCSPDYLAANPVGTPEDLLTHNLLRHPWHSWAAWFHAAGVVTKEPEGGPEYADSSLLTDAAEAGEGVALMRSLSAADPIQNGALTRLFDISVADERAYYFVRSAGNRDPALDELEEWLASELRRAGQGVDANG